MKTLSLLSVVLLAAFLFQAEIANAQDAKSKTWAGTWTNKKYNTTGPLKCVATPGKDGKWKATFTGKFQGDPFKYQAEFSSKPGKGMTLLAGKSKVRGHDYQWTGNIKGTTLTGKYNSSVGYYGNFVLKEPRR